MKISVVIATRNRGASVARLVVHLQAQSLDPRVFEVIIVDDGSSEPVAPHLEGLEGRLALDVVRIPWSGQAAARHHGALRARGDVLVFLDDDMQIDPTFLERLDALHASVNRLVVLGRIDPDPGLGAMPLFERYHARQLDRYRRAVLSGDRAPKGQDLCTGNVSMRRSDYLAVGGFDETLARSEDRELGIRLEKAGCSIFYGDTFASVHSSDHASVAVWLRRAFLYGQFDHRIAVKHPDVPSAHPWAFWSLIHPLSRPVVGLALLWPPLGRILARLFYAVGVAGDRLGAERMALTFAAFAYALAYFAGLRVACGSLTALRGDVRKLAPRARGPFGRFRAAVRADHDAVRRYRLKYGGETIPSSRILLDAVMKVGFQIMVAYRVMRLLDECHLGPLAMIASRLMRHLYGADIHWKAQIDPGVSIVHGAGLIVSPKARVGAGAILFQHVTLGENIDAVTGAIGAPSLETDVHVGPGAVLLGPITVGASTKIGANAVVMRNVPGGSLVMPPEAAVTQRQVRRGRAA